VTVAVAVSLAVAVGDGSAVGDGVGSAVGLAVTVGSAGAGDASWAQATAGRTGRVTASAASRARAGVVRRRMEDLPEGVPGRYRHRSEQAPGTTHNGTSGLLPGRSRAVEVEGGVMRTRPALAAAAAVLGAALAVPASAAPSAPGLPAAAQLQEVDGEETRSYVVPTRHGSIYLEVLHPTLGGKLLPAHGILTLSPYSVLGRNGDAKSYVPRGYARMHADVVGTGNSGGCYDYGGKREIETGHDLVEWIAAQPWSRGRVGMTGGSYDGTTATATAISKPKGLATIVPEVAISRWYDYAYSGGMRYTYTNEMIGKRGAGAAAEEGFDTPVAFDFGLAVPPAARRDRPGLGRPRRRTPCASATRCSTPRRATTSRPTTTPSGWERDYARQAPQLDLRLWSSTTGATERQAGHRPAAVEALPKGPRTKLYMGDRFSGHGTPGGEYKLAKLAWMDRWVGGVKNGIEHACPGDLADVQQRRRGRLPRRADSWTKPVVLSSTDGPGAWPGRQGRRGPSRALLRRGSESRA
jgi:hypothetical protein